MRGRTCLAMGAGVPVRAETGEAAVRLALACTAVHARCGYTWVDHFKNKIDDWSNNMRQTYCLLIKKTNCEIN